MEATQVPINRQVDTKVWYIHTVKYHWAIRNEILPFVTMVNLLFFFCQVITDGPRGYYAKRNKSVREKQIPYAFTYIWNL